MATVDDRRTLRPFFRWFDLWVGAYIDWEKRLLYVCPLPMLGIRIPIGTPPERPAQPQVFRRIEPTPLFQRAFVNSASLCQVVCEPCGRVHFVAREVATGDYEEGEMEALERNAADAPEWYVVEREHDSIEVGYVSGRQVVVHCPCHYLRIWESFVRDNRFSLAGFLRLLASQALDVGTLEKEMLEVPENSDLAAADDRDRRFYPGETT